MQKEKLQIILNTIAQMIRELIPEGKSASKLAMEYGMSVSEMSGLVNAQKNLSFFTFARLAEMFGMTIDEFAKELKNRLPKDFRISEL